MFMSCVYFPNVPRQYRMEFLGWDVTISSYLLIILSGSAQLTKNTWTPINIRNNIRQRPIGEYSSSSNSTSPSFGNL